MRGYSGATQSRSAIHARSMKQNIMIKRMGIMCLCLLLRMLALSQQHTGTAQYNVVWNTPSGDSFGSMPLGNGDIGLNVWVETNGDLLFYISKVDAFDAGHLLPKLGRIRFRTEPALSVDRFKQILNLMDASVSIEARGVNFRIWVDANQPVVRMEGRSQTPRRAIVSLESLRPLANSDESLPQEGTVGVLFNDKEHRLAWCYRNQSSWWAENFKNQNTPDMVARTKDPILYRTSGCLLRAEGCTREVQPTLKSRKRSTTFDCSVKVISTQPENLQAWLVEASKPLKTDWAAHCAYWKSFWNRSYVNITSGGEGMFDLDQCRFTQFAQGSKAYEGHKNIDAAKNVFQISQRYTLERFCQAAAGRGAVPAPYNGSIFTMDMPAGVLGFDKPKEIRSLLTDATGHCFRLCGRIRVILIGRWLHGATTMPFAPECILFATDWIFAETAVKRSSDTRGLLLWKPVGGIMSVFSTGRMYRHICATISWLRWSCRPSCANTTNIPAIGNFWTRFSCLVPMNS